MAVLIVAFVTAINDYSQELQFRSLERSSQADEQTTVIREGSKVLVNPSDLTVGDVVILLVRNGASVLCKAYPMLLVYTRASM
jgi:magnesium-transporting ATPase (P-type)